MNNKSYILCILGFLASFSVDAGCISIRGSVRTQAINEFEQVGRIRLSSDAVAFKEALGLDEIEGGIHGTIDSQAMTIILHHQMGFPGVGSLTSEGDQAAIVGAPDSAGNYPVIEALKINQPTSPLNGAFYGWTFQNVIAKGIINLKTGANSFAVTGKMCR